jgi:hypothetical protein
MNDLAHTQPAAADSAERDRANDGERIFTGNLFRVRDGRGWAFTAEPPPPPPAQTRRPARVAQALALAHRLQAAIDRGEHRDRAELARQLGFTRARVTQLLDLLLLAPDIQERVLDLEAVDGVEPLAERALRAVVRHDGWAEQQSAWAALPLTGSSCS